MQKYRKAVFVVVYSRTKKRIEYLLLKRKLHWKGWEFTKGGIEKGEKEEQAVKRELMEETGRKAAAIKKFNFYGRYRYRRIFPSRPGMIGQTYSLFAAEVKKAMARLDEREHSAYAWLPYEKASRLLRWKDQRKSLRIVDSWLMHGRKKQKGKKN